MIVYISKEHFNFQQAVLKVFILYIYSLLLPNKTISKAAGKKAVNVRCILFFHLFFGGADTKVIPTKVPLF